MEYLTFLLAVICTGLFLRDSRNIKLTLDALRNIMIEMSALKRRMDNIDKQNNTIPKFQRNDKDNETTV